MIGLMLGDTLMSESVTVPVSMLGMMGIVFVRFTPTQPRDSGRY